MSFYGQYPIEGGGSGGGVTSLNALTGALSLIAGSGITITPSGSNITIASTGGSGANTTLSNLTSPTAINQDLLPGAAGTINFGSSALPFLSANSNTFFVYDNSGNAIAELSKGPNTQLEIATLVPGITSAIILSTANGTSAASGDIAFETGTASAGVSGSIIGQTGQTSGTNVSGSVQMISGNHTGTSTSGGAFLQTGNATASGGATGAVNVTSGNVNTGTGNSGLITISSGSVHSGVSGALSMMTGTGNSAGSTSGNITISTGQAPNSGSTSGSVSITTGSTGTGTAGSISIIGGNSSSSPSLSGSLSLMDGNNAGISISAGNGTSMTDEVGTQAVFISSTDREFDDATGTKSIDFLNRFLVDVTGSVNRVDWSDASGVTGVILTGQVTVIPTGTADPTGIDGAMYVNTSTSQLRVFFGGTWKGTTLT